MSPKLSFILIVIVAFAGWVAYWVADTPSYDCYRRSIAVHSQEDTTLAVQTITKEAQQAFPEAHIVIDPSVTTAILVLESDAPEITATQNPDGSWNWTGHGAVISYRVAASVWICQGSSIAAPANWERLYTYRDFFRHTDVQRAEQERCLEYLPFREGFDPGWAIRIY